MQGTGNVRTVRKAATIDRLWPVPKSSNGSLVSGAWIWVAAFSTNFERDEFTRTHPTSLLVRLFRSFFGRSKACESSNDNTQSAV